MSLECPVESLRNVQGIGKVRRKLRGILRAAQHSASKACVMCNQTLPPAPEFPSKPKKTPCCNSVRCNTCVMRKMECAHCSTSLKILPCLFCKGAIDEHRVPDWYESLARAKRCRTPCCGEDCCTECKQREESTPFVCFLCSTPFTNWEIDHFKCKAPQYLCFFERETKKNSWRRYHSLDYDDRQLGHPH